MIRHTYLLIVSVTIVTLNGCETTGDPRQGGLFGWSESKAEARQAALRQDATAAQSDANAQQALVSNNQAQAASLSSQVSSLQSRLDALLAENDKLETQLKGLLRKKQASVQELSIFQAHLKENDALRQSVAQTGARGQAASARRASQAINSQNQRMNDDILFLLDR